MKRQNCRCCKTIHFYKRCNTLKRLYQYYCQQGNCPAFYKHIEEIEIDFTSRFLQTHLSRPAIILMIQSNPSNFLLTSSLFLFLQLLFLYPFFQTVLPYFLKSMYTNFKDQRLQNNGNIIHIEILLVFGEKFFHLQFCVSVNIISWISININISHSFKYHTVLLCMLFHT